MAKKLVLKGCPLCGSKAYWTRGDKSTKMTDRVMCLECSLSIEADYRPQSALELWNMRVSDYQAETRDVNIEGENL